MSIGITISLALGALQRAVAALAPGAFYRVTEAGDTRTTQAGDTRITG